MRKCLLMLALVAGVFVMPIAAQEGAAPLPACDGDYAIVRISQIKPTGSMAGFMKAVDAHKAWYRSHGFMNNEIYTAKIAVRDPAKKTWSFSTDQIMTFHVRPPEGAKHDAAWDAYVKMYSDNSDIKTEYIACMPKTK